MSLTYLSCKINVMSDLKYFNNNIDHKLINRHLGKKVSQLRIIHIRNVHPFEYKAICLVTVAIIIGKQ
jgi:hypothetical protein